jgi:hypothetical protein
MERACTNAPCWQSVGGVYGQVVRSNAYVKGAHAQLAVGIDKAGRLCREHNQPSDGALAALAQDEPDQAAHDALVLVLLLGSRIDNLRDELHMERGAANTRARRVA